MDSAQGKNIVLTDYARNLIRVKAHQLRTRRDFRNFDSDDLQQELWLAVCERIDRFDPTKASLDTFIDLVVNKALASLLRRRQRLKRDKGTVAHSLDSMLPSRCGAPTRLGDLLTEADLVRRTGHYPCEMARDPAFGEALAHALSEMPEDLRDICQRLMSGTVNSVACELNVSRRAIRNACQAIREYFERAGMKNS